MKELTQRQREVLTFIKSYINTHTYPPTIREVAENFSISVKGAYDHLYALKKKGQLKYEDKRSRTMELVEDETSLDHIVYIPKLGTVAAGKPILSEENFDGYIPVHSTLLKKNADYFILIVRGDSMIQAGIMDGDLALIEKREYARNGEIIVAVVDEAITLKRFFKESSRIRLQTENPIRPDIYSQDVRVIGRLAWVFRNYSE